VNVPLNILANLPEEGRGYFCISILIAKMLQLFGFTSEDEKIFWSSSASRG
jgi:hypothetical protein